MSVTPATSGLTDGCDLSPQQMRTWMLSQACPAAYTSQCILGIEGRIDLDRLRSAVDGLVRRHEMLRMRLSSQESRLLPVQAVASAAGHEIEYIDAACEADRDPARGLRVRAVADAARARTFEAERETFRIAVVREAVNRHAVIFTAPAYCLDARSFDIVLRELAADLRDEVEGGASDEEPLSYLSAAGWLNEILDDPARETGRAYWRDADRFSPQVGFREPTERSRSSFAPARAVVDLPDLPSRSTLDAHDTVAPFLAAAWVLLLSRSFGADSPILGVAQDGRKHPELLGIFGPWTKYVPVGVTLDPTLPFADLADRLAAGIKGAHAWQEYYRPANSDRYFAYAFDFHARPAGEQAGTVRLSIADQWCCPDRFDLKLVGIGRPGFPAAEIHYDSARFSPDEIAYLRERLATICAEALEHGDRPIGTFSIIGPSERRRLAAGANETPVQFDHGLTLHERFDAQAAATPNALAVTDEHQSITYAALNSRSNKLARHLKGLGAGPDVLVALYLERSIDMIVGILGILKAGAAYLPIDPVYPADRIAFMLADAEAPIVVTQSSLLFVLPPLRASIVCLDADTDAIDSQPDTTPPCETGLDHLAYVIYTSGSTGTPKGALVTHRNVVRLMLSLTPMFEFDERDVWTMFHSIAFDFSVWEMWGALLYGGRLVVVPYLTTRSPRDFCRLLVDEGVTVVNQTPSAFRQIVEAEGQLDLRDRLALRAVIFGGEALEMRSLAPWFARHGDQHPRLVNMYGITETTVFVTHRELSNADGELGTDIGVPLSDLRVYVLDGRQQLAPTAVAGELYVGGPGVGQGYFKRSALTAERFVPDPFSNEPGARLYRSGDQARVLANGHLEYLGRLDDQVKIRGFRIELGEIEAVLGRYNGIARCAVLVREDRPGDQRLVAYIEPRSASTPAIADLRAHLERHLPPYMVPSAFVVVSEWPLTHNGKLDRRALAAQSALRQAHASPAYAAPRTPLEQALCDSWRDVLALEAPVGIHDDFFELGGHSLVAVQLAFRMRTELGFDVGVGAVLEHPTVARLAAFLEQADGAGQHSILVQMRPGVASSVPLYFVHAGDGGVLCYQELAERLDDDKPFYAIQAPRSDSELSRSTTIERIAADYLKVIQRHVAGRPYQLGGWSFGGLVAFEMARQARLDARPPEMVFLIDPATPGNQEGPVRTEEELTSGFVSTLIHLLGGADRALRAEAEDIPASLDFESQLRRALRHGYLPTDVDLVACQEAFATYCRCIRAIHAYSAEPYDGAAMLIRPHGSHDQPSGRDPWSGLLPADAPRPTLGEDHRSMIRGVHAGRLASLMLARHSVAS